MRRSFTLLETVTAAALLAMLAASSIGALRSITLVADRAGAAVDVGALSLIVDELLADPEAHGLPQPADGAAWHELTARHPEHPAEITIRRAVSEMTGAPTRDAPARRHTWLSFESQGAAVARWLPLPELEQAP